MTKMMTLADATDARHLADARDIVRERKQMAKDAMRAAQLEVSRCERQCIEVIKLGLLDETLTLHIADLKTAKAKYDAAEIAFHTL